MKYAIKLKANNAQGFSVFSMLSEYTGSGGKPMVFESIGDAEVFAQNHELPNYTIIPITEEKEGAQLLNG